MSGCGIFSPEEKKGDVPKPPPAYPIPESPKKALLAYELAYEAIDPEMFMQLYDSLAYTGTSTDLNDTAPPIPFVYADEMAHIWDLKHRPGIRTYLNIGSEGNWSVLPSDDLSHPDWAIIQIDGANFSVEIADGENVHKAQGSPGTFIEFAFEPTPDATSPSGELWKIVRWRELGTSAPDP